MKPGNDFGRAGLRLPAGWRSLCRLDPQQVPSRRARLPSRRMDVGVSGALHSCTGCPAETIGRSAPVAPFRCVPFTSQLAHPLLEPRIGPQGLEERIPLKQLVAGEPGPCGPLEPFLCLGGLSELSIGGPDAVGDMMVHVGAGGDVAE